MIIHSLVECATQFVFSRLIELVNDKKMSTINQLNCITNFDWNITWRLELRKHTETNLTYFSWYREEPSLTAEDANVSICNELLNCRETVDTWQITNWKEHEPCVIKNIVKENFFKLTFYSFKLKKNSLVSKGFFSACHWIDHEEIWSASRNRKCNGGCLFFRKKKYSRTG